MRVLFLILFLFSTYSFSSEHCENWSLPHSTITKNDISQQDSGMCHAFRDSKALEYFHDSVGIDTKESSALEVATIFHRKMLFLKQIIGRKYLSADYRKGESVLDWGRTCEAINNILDNGLCKKNTYSSSSYHYIYNLFRNLVGVNLKECDSCDQGPIILSNEQKNQWSKTLIGLTAEFIHADQGLSPEEKNELQDFVQNALSTKKSTDYKKIVKSMERKVKRNCKKRDKVSVYEQYECKSHFFPEVLDSDRYGEQAVGYLKDYLRNRDNQPVMASICSAKLSSSKDPKDFTFNDGVGSLLCGPHAVLIVGQKKLPDGSCQILIEDNYPGKCIQDDMPWAKCEVEEEGKTTGRYWIARERLGPMMIGIGKISKKKAHN